LNHKEYDPTDDDTDDNSSFANVYFSRLHIRYNRNSFPQDLMFQETSNSKNFQARYIITHPASGDLNCAAGKKYLDDLKQRRKDEMKTLISLTGKGYTDWDLVSSADEEKSIPVEDSYRDVALEKNKTGKRESGILYATLGVMGLLSLAGIRQRRKKID